MKSVELESNQIELIKRLVEITQGRVVFTGSFTDVILGVSTKFHDLDFIIEEKDLFPLKEFGLLRVVNETPLFKQYSRFFINNKIICLDIFLKNSNYPLDLKIQSKEFEGIEVKTLTPSSSIQTLRMLIKNDPLNYNVKKLNNRIRKLKTLL